MENAKKVFVSVGRTSTPSQEAFVKAIEDRIEAEGLKACTVGRNYWTAGAPLKAVIELMKECSGVVIIALERTYYPMGTERRGHPQEAVLKDTRLPTPYNQVEAAMAYCHGHPLMVIVEDGIKCEGLLEKGNDWYVLSVHPTPDSLITAEFNGVFASWKKDVTGPRKTSPLMTSFDPEKMTIWELVGRMKVTHLWTVLGALGLLIMGAFSLGAKLIGK